MIRGIILQGTENKITQYADDTELMLEGDRISFQEAMNTVQHFDNKTLESKCGKDQYSIYGFNWKQANFTCEVHATLEKGLEP